MSPMNRVNVVLDADTLTALEIIEDATGASRSEHLRRAVKLYVKEARALYPAISERLDAKPAKKSRRK